jgi:hypothetical protein
MQVFMFLTLQNELNAVEPSYAARPLKLDVPKTNAVILYQARGTGELTAVVIMSCEDTAIIESLILFLDNFCSNVQPNHSVKFLDGKNLFSSQSCFELIKNYFMD